MSDSPSSGTGATRGAVPSLVFCHQCGIEVRPLMAPDPTCPRCNGQFVEVIEEGAHPRSLYSFFGDGDEDDEDDDDADVMGDDGAAYMAHMAGNRPAAFGGFGSPPLGPAAMGGRADLGGLIQNLLGAVAANRAATMRAQQQRQQQQQSSHSTENRDGSSAERSSTSSTSSTFNSSSTSSSTRTAQFGPLSFTWGVQNGPGDPLQRDQRSDDPPRPGSTATQSSPPMLSDFLRTAFGPRDTEPARRAAASEHEHDDGMGGAAGSAADGRRFNHDNLDGRAGAGERPNDELPPELAGLRNLFTGLFGGNMDGGGLIFDFLGRGGAGDGSMGRGQWGDYVLGQQGLDDIISQLMEQTQSSNAPPPAGDEEIAQLERFKISDEARVAKAKNRDCPTCKEDFLPETSAESANQPDDCDDPPEQGAGDEGETDTQQEDLAMMPCNHLFHEDCLVPWLKMHGTCPVCRISIVKPSSSSGGGGEQASSPAAQDSAAAGDGATTSQSGAAAATPTQQNRDPFSALFNFATRAATGGGSGGGGSGATGAGTGSAQNVPGSFPVDSHEQRQSGAAHVDADDETPEQRRERMRRAAEARQRTAAQGGGGHEGESSATGFLEPDELD